MARRSLRNVRMCASLIARVLGNVAGCVRRSRISHHERAHHVMVLMLQEKEDEET